MAESQGHEIINLFMSANSAGAPGYEAWARALQSPADMMQRQHLRDAINRLETTIAPLVAQQTHETDTTRPQWGYIFALWVAVLRSSIQDDSQSADSPFVLFSQLNRASQDVFVRVVGDIRRLASSQRHLVSPKIMQDFERIKPTLPSESILTSSPPNN
jgi:hypothetical protein